MITTHLNCVILGLGTYFFPINAFPKQTCAMCRRIRKPHKLKVRRFAACRIDLNSYLAILSGAKGSDKIGETELNEILLNIMPNGWGE